MYFSKYEIIVEVTYRKDFSCEFQQQTGKLVHTNMVTT